MGLWEDFKNFALKGNVIELAVAVVIALAFQAVINAFVVDIINGLIGIPGKADFSAFKLTINGSDILYGTFINAVIAFVVIALVIFFVLVRPYQKYKARTEKKPAPAPVTKECPFCITQISIKATRCPNCTSQLPA